MPDVTMLFDPVSAGLVITLVIVAVVGIIESVRSKK